MPLCSPVGIEPGGLAKAFDAPSLPQSVEVLFRWARSRILREIQIADIRVSLILGLVKRRSKSVSMEILPGPKIKISKALNRKV
jgi:hypothetical protein